MRATLKVRAHNGQMVVELHRALISYWLNEWYYTTNHAAMATSKMVVGGGFGPPMFTTWVAVLQTALFGQLQKPYEKMARIAGLEPALPYGLIG